MFSIKRLGLFLGTLTAFSTTTLSADCTVNFDCSSLCPNGNGQITCSCKLSKNVKTCQCDDENGCETGIACCATLKDNSTQCNSAKCGGPHQQILLPSPILDVSIADTAVDKDEQGSVTSFTYSIQNNSAKKLTAIAVDLGIAKNGAFLTPMRNSVDFLFSDDGGLNGHSVREGIAVTLAVKGLIEDSITISPTVRYAEFEDGSAEGAVEIGGELSVKRRSVWSLYQELSQAYGRPETESVLRSGLAIQPTDTYYAKSAKRRLLEVLNRQGTAALYLEIHRPFRGVAVAR